MPQPAIEGCAEYRWAHHTLYTWLGPFKSLSQLAAEGVTGGKDEAED